MATLTPPFERLVPGATYTFQAKMFGWHTVGTCTVTESSPFRFAASGAYDVMGKRGDFDLALELGDRDAGAASGPCTIVGPGVRESGTYARSGDAITFEGAGRTVTVSPAENGGVAVRINGLPEGRIVP